MESKTFDPKNYPYTTNNPELLEIIKRDLELEETPLAERIEKLPDVAKEHQKKLVEVYKRLIELENDPKWNELSKEKDFSAYTMKNEAGFIAIKSVGILPFKPIEAVAYLNLEQYKKDYDDMLKEGKIVDQYPCNMVLLNEIYKGNMIVSQRDFCFVAQKIFESDGSIVLPVISVEDSRVPLVKSNVRAKILIAGWILRPIEGGKTRGAYIVSMDLGGSIPGFVQTMAAKGQGMLAKKFAEAYVKRFNK